LLDAYEHDGDFLATPAGIVALDENPLDDAPPEETTGATIGPYTLLGLIGEGGFGLVFLAEQQHPVRRRVAVKVLKPGMDSRRVIARFEAERQALAMMDHPNIAKMLDAGETASGRPYFAMELVKGDSITKSRPSRARASRAGSREPTRCAGAPARSIRLSLRSPLPALCSKANWTGSS